MGTPEPTPTPTATPEPITDPATLTVAVTPYEAALLRWGSKHAWQIVAITCPPEPGTPGTPPPTR